MNPDQEAFLAYIKIDPWDSLRYHIYADWLEENNQPEEAIRQRKIVPAMKRMEKFARSCDDASYDEVMDAGWNAFRNPNSGTEVGKSCGFGATNQFDGEIKKAFWDNWEIITGVRVNEDIREIAGVFSCCESW